MTNTGGTPAGWYYAQGDPDGTQRYWDGAQWIGDPQQVPQAQPRPEPQQTPPASSPPPTDDMTVQYRPPSQESPAPAGFDAPGAQQPASGGFAAPGAGQPSAAPDYSAPGAFAAGGPPSYDAPPGAPGVAPGYQGFAPPSSGPGTPAEWGTRAIAFLIDWALSAGIFLVGFLLAVIGGAIADALGVVLFIVTYIAAFAFFIWNQFVRQGSTGQTIGKEKQGIKLVKDETGQPVGGGMAFVRYLLAGVLSGVTCGIYGILDYLWPLWDADNKRLTDKIVTMSVVTV